MDGWITLDDEALTFRFPAIPEDYRALFWLLGFAALLIVVLKGAEALSRGSPVASGSRRYRATTGFLQRHYVKLIFGAAGLVVAWALLIGLWRVPNLVGDLLQDLKGATATGDSNATRNIIVALTAVLGGIAIIGTVIVQSIRVWINERTARTAEENLTTGLINKAVEGLGAEKQIDTFWRVVRYTLDGKEDGALELRGEAPLLPAGAEVTGYGDWEAGTRTVPNIEVRLGATYTLERIAQDNDRDHIRVMEILCAYLRENAPAGAAADHGLGEWPEWSEGEARAGRDAAIAVRRQDLDKWVAALPRPRTDIQAAIEVIGRRTPWQAEIERAQRHRQSDEPYRLDLTGVNLRRADLSSLDLARALLGEARLEGADLREARLEGADLREARLEGANLRGARLEWAALREARLEGADLREARLEEADFREARLEGTNLAGVQLESAALVAARLEGADLRGARLNGAHLTWASLEGTDLREASLEGANLVGARLEGANLVGAELKGAILAEARLVGAKLRLARLEGADLSGADLRSSTWAGASCRASPAQSADLRGAEGLTQDQLENLIGNEDTLLPDPSETGKSFYVWSCWETPPKGFDALVERVARFTGVTEEKIRAAFLCGPGNPRHTTGKPWPLDQPRPEGHPLGP
ncbi:pentapeptide repeat-containing protein [Amaricoccus sp.]|uniref:pentapeptide repeat-containing protein n=1 Tax=Amaricoccus sp. TaxID=1872485 RepID=UPI001B5EB73C|nr:pentapeptide repeat-containing protein [Amaricoccus sp.]MBP7242274.1 pentapeptide repeat-containing protein [Amaricoccus sp.]